MLFLLVGTADILGMKYHNLNHIAGIGFHASFNIGHILDVRIYKVKLSVLKTSH